MSKIFWDVFTSEDVDADSTDQNEYWFVFCDCVVLLTATWFYIFVVKAIFYSFTIRLFVKYYLHYSK
jgi:hypothetical protein